MEKPVIQDKVQQLHTVEDLAKLLDEIKHEEFGISYHEITRKKLLHFAYAAKGKDKYKTFHIRKKSGGLREINAPSYQLGILLYLINILLKSVYTPSPSVMGFTEGRSVVDNAKMHVGHHYVFNTDLKDFFPSIPQARVWKRLQLPPFNFTQEIANVIAGLCCHEDANRHVCVLPQGAPTSPLLTNAICDKLDRRMRGLSKRFGLHYSRYADDMTFSSMHNVYQEGSDFRLEMRRIIEGQGFTLNERKTRLLRDGQRQEVTGLTVNSIVNVSRKYVSDLRWLLHIWETEGYAKAYSLFYPKYKQEKGYIKKGEPVMENVIGGKLNYLRMVKGPSNPAYVKLQARYDKLQQPTYVDSETDKGKAYVYVQSYPMADFKRLFSTNVILEISPKKKLVGKCTLAGMDKVISISASTQKKLCPDAADLSVGAIVMSDQLESCYVTLCRARGKNFWLITKSEFKRSACLSVQSVHVDVDTLLSIWKKYGFDAAECAFQECVRDGVEIKMPEEEEKSEEKKNMRGKGKNVDGKKTTQKDKKPMWQILNELLGDDSFYDLA